LREKLAHDQADAASHRASLAAIGRGGGNTEAQIVKPSGRVFDEADVEREAKADEQNYLLYLSKRERERTASAPDRHQTVTVTIAAPPTLPASPAHHRAVIALIALALATFVSLPAAIIVDCLDRGFHSPDEVIESLGITVVLAVPRRTA
jgi:capsular polysaccharide biosynthesis protein